MNKRESQSRPGELGELYAADQLDREGTVDEIMEKWELIRKNDKERLQRVEELEASGLIESAEDLYCAAMIYHHNGPTENYARAIELSRRSMELGSEDGKWLLTRAEDRYRQSIDEPQIWGTQFERGEDGVWRLREPFEEDAKTEEERREMGIDFVAKAEKLNRDNR